jgi:2-amino-4-hydroxy-6-hydroxymethyldihydropteridine diphosphokinase
MKNNDNDSSSITRQRLDISSYGAEESFGPTRTTYLSLGSNLGDKSENLLLGVKELLKLDEHLKISRVYETKPVGGPAGQDNYYNTAVALDTSLHPYDLLSLVNGIESAAKRVRKERFGPRTLDIDILIMDGVLMSDESLTIPHPRMHERAFVLAPLSDLVNIAELTIFTAIYPQFLSSSWYDVLGSADTYDLPVVLDGVNIDPRLLDEI